MLTEKSCYLRRLQKPPSIEAIRVTLDPQRHDTVNIDVDPSLKFEPEYENEFKEVVERYINKCFITSENLCRIQYSIFDVMMRAYQCGHVYEVMPFEFLPQIEPPESQEDDAELIDCPHCGGSGKVCRD